MLPEEQELAWLEGEQADGTPAAQANLARERASRSSEEAALVIKEQPKTTSENDLALKQAYRKAVKLMQPDLALSDRERQRRTALMAAPNNAYELGDGREIERLIEEFGQDPYAIVGEDVASRIVKATRRIAQLHRRLAALKTEQDPKFWGEVQPPASLKGLDIPSRRTVFVPWKPSRRPAFGMGNPTFR